VNWEPVQLKNPDAKLLGFIAYKVGMDSALIKDSTAHSMTKDKKIPVTVSILETPPIKIFSVRFYKNNKVVCEIISENVDKELKKLVKLPRAKTGKKIEDIKDYDDLRLIVYSVVGKTGIKKTPDITEIGLAGKVEEKLAFAKEHLGKEISASEVLKSGQLIDVRGLSKGKGHTGAVQRFGIGYKNHKSEKGRKRPGSLAPWHPHYVTFRTPMSGGQGMFTRIQYNSKVLSMGKIQEKNINPSGGFRHFGAINSDYLIIEGSIPGPQKREMLLTFPLRKTKSAAKKNYEFIKIIEN
jgi:large subunit ribosomal protein L3